MVVNGGILIGDSIQGSPEAGTIEYFSVDDDFYGYNSEGVELSLTGVQLQDGVTTAGYIAWVDENIITATQIYILMAQVWLLELVIQLHC